MSTLYLVAGLGKTGRSIAGYLKRRCQPFVVFDTRRQVAGLAEFIAEFPGVEVFLGELPATIYNQLTGIILSPGISLDELFLRPALSLDIPIFGDIECLAREVKAPIIAITGTNGKSTVTTLVGEMAKAAGFSVAVAGNIGSPVLDLLDDQQDYDLWVLELSSFQLDLTHSLAAVAATILNISPDHLDRHHSLEAYIKAKQRIYRQAQFLLYNRDDRQTIPDASLVSQTAIASYSLHEPTAGGWGIIEKNGVNYLAQGTDCFMAVDKLLIKGKHNWQNALAASALAAAAGIGFNTIVKTLQSFSGLPHRCQWIRRLNGVDWIDDSKGTNIGATISAISGIGGSMQGKIVLIAGGQGKGADFEELRLPVGDYVRSVVLIGEDAERIESALSDVVPVLHALSLDGAVALAKEQAKPGDVVLLSPACASFDMFRDFNHRGEVYTQLVGKL
ncbi:MULTISPECIES: UDP-N-acetylmuramoyl-L-alanine--D-glutamate ligase [unclassified Legionella]|uniref:UDP-N-acetylmuramoyl-L-alanine--D-glutamate ligase n=1 Tax=unclassified Legionella TaxID=2622702 RepID=UPI0010549E82|nr:MULTISPECIES: UDP-N-acetylmuramoyl-L-alanine--D-glutamate ligase [unclassified Legionella]MDI9819212.1 UDP-N-acetylmuramoyl-L-alanine--D-glutamate ligase [Legionella sp. PL877]